ncbi:hypothetical protein MAPG_08916 [Magnaporthiopsis poae ATCC 64411]|uniref:Uncharacterized protein n=1 Tax=Magnaporthiopsis poae (strain ATCC 64411 / 73-15) TaxID=644358 RepID=A0A0C4E8K7_MAGP6|nr:hypothetical protein MAPG_08916 [Magnaporthiopsis poae ATCC 64411]
MAREDDASRGATTTEPIHRLDEGSPAGMGHFVCEVLGTAIDNGRLEQTDVSTRRRAACVDPSLRITALAVPDSHRKLSVTSSSDVELGGDLDAGAVCY